MGILSFTKKSRKQGQRLPFALDEHLPSREAHNIPLQKPKETPRNYFEPSSRRHSETSLLDDIMKELDTKDQPRIILTEKRQSLQPLLRFDDAETYNPAVTPSEQYAEINPSTPTSQARPKPLISFANEQPDMIVMGKRDTILHSDITTSSSIDADDVPILSKQRQMKRHSIADVTQAQQVQQVQQVQQPASYMKAKPQAKPLNRNLMDRMKERHRQEARMSLQAIPFIDSPMQQVRSHPLSSPSMPIIYNPMNEKQPPVKPVNNIIQSPSFTPYSPPPPPPQNHMVRSASFATDIYGGKNYSAITMPIQAQSDINFRPAPTSPYAFMRTPSHSQINMRVGYQQAPIYTPSLQPENTFIEEPLQQQEQRYLNRSSSAHLFSTQIHPLQRSSETIQHKQDINKTTEIPSPPVEKQKSKANTLKKPLYERATSPGPPQHQHQHQHHHYHHHHKEYIEPICSPRGSTSEFISHTDTPDTPPPESHSRHSVETTTKEDENLPPSPASIHSNLLSNDVESISATKNASEIEKNQKSISENSIEPVEGKSDNSVILTMDQYESQQEQEMLKNKTDANSVAETIATSETSKTKADVITQDKNIKYSKAGIHRVFQLPRKLKHELQGVQLRRSSYSVPDLTEFTKQDDDSAVTLAATHWSEIETAAPMKIAENNEKKSFTNEQTKSIQTDREEKPVELISHSRECMSQTITPSVSRIDLYSCCSSIPVSCCQRNSFSCHSNSDHHYNYLSQSHRCHSCSHKHSNHSSTCSSNNNSNYCHHKNKSCMKKSSSICSAMRLDHHSMMSHSPSQQHLHGHHCSKKRNKHRHSSDRHESSHRHNCSHSRYRLDESNLLEEAGGY